MKLRMASSKQKSSLGAMAMSQLPPPYAPCVRPISELEKIAISDMKLETHHRGKRTALRVLTPPDRMTAVMAIVEDEQGTALLLQLYYQPDESVVPAEEIMQLGDVFILKEPFFKTATDGSYTLRVDHLGDIVRLANSDDRIPSQWSKQPPNLRQSSIDIRVQGNEAVQKKKWAEAHRLYTSAIQIAETPEDEQLARLNRSLANMRLGRPAEALSDARRCDNPSGPSEKGLFREARALYELGYFDQSLERLESLTASYLENTAAKPEIQRVKARLREQHTGFYSFRKMYRQAREMPPLIDCATFSAPVEVRASPGRGNGLFTVIPVSAGQLLLCEKAFGYAFAGEGHPETMSLLLNVATKKGVIGGQARLLTQLIQKMYHDPWAQKSYHELHHGGHGVPSVSEVDGHSVIDSFLVAQIQSINAFGAPKTSRDSISQRTAGEGGQKTVQEGKFATTGLWLLTSRINHSCVGNCRRSFIGDMQIIRAARDLEAGTELLFGYRAPQHLESYADVQRDLSSWGFRCNCELCISRKETTEEALAHRKALTKQLSKVLNGHQGTNVPAVRRILLQMEKTYPPGVPEAIRLELWDPYFALGAVLLSEGKPAECIRMIVRGMETLGFAITTTAGGKMALEVTRWGYMTDMMPWAFLHLFRAYERLAPELCVAAKKYAGIAYSILVGEEETLGDEFPQLA
ncbi:Protein unc-45-like protein A [Colletotrichum spinosum]|uniref:Protein unc-45-like protein A n=2 Tax=Colletotrichum orbiculare species complex TaxID=2707354 RepID=A0A4R8QMN6_COLTR|nr:Protein unc-45-like protein A [Colletotrichum spinosum]TDZ40331.1 Protein unc-45-like protein A [Colletotrichum trifolii]